MGRITIATVKLTNQSFLEAIQRFTNRGFDCIDQNSACNMAESFTSYEKHYTQSDECYFSVESLLEYGRPKHIEKTHWVYKDSFVKLSFRAYEEYEQYAFGQNPFVDRKIKLNVEFGKFGIGIGGWTEEKKQELRDIAKDCKKEVQDKIFKCINEADAELNKYRAEKTKILNEFI